MRVKSLFLLLIGSLVIFGTTAVNKERAIAGSIVSTKNIVADIKPSSERSRNILAAKAYTDEEILKLAKKYFDNNCKENGDTVEIDSVDGDTVTIHVYEYIDEGNGEGHTATYNWYYISKKTGKGKDFFGNEIDLNKLSGTKTGKMYSDKKITIEDLTYKLTAKKYDKTEKMKVRNIMQISKSTGETTSLVKKVTSEKVVTNGKQLYYSKNVNNKGVVYRLDISTGKSHKVISGKGYVLLGGTDKNLYIGVSNSKNKSGYDKYTYNLKAKKLVTVYD